MSNVRGSGSILCGRRRSSVQDSRDGSHGAAVVSQGEIRLDNEALKERESHGRRR